MKSFRWWMLAVPLLLLRRVDTEHLQAENLNVIRPHEHDLVLNRGTKGIFSLSVMLSILTCDCGESSCDFYFK